MFGKFFPAHRHEVLSLVDYEWRQVLRLQCHTVLCFLQGFNFLSKRLHVYFWLNLFRIESRVSEFVSIPWGGQSTCFSFRVQLLFLTQRRFLRSRCKFDEVFRCYSVLRSNRSQMLNQHLWRALTHIVRGSSRFNFILFLVENVRMRVGAFFVFDLQECWLSLIETICWSMLVAYSVIVIFFSVSWRSFHLKSRLASFLG